MGLDGDAAAAACKDENTKHNWLAACEEAVSKGVFGAPWVIVDGEPFWGQ